jgi:hypothetical protein
MYFRPTTASGNCTVRMDIAPRVLSVICGGQKIWHSRPMHRALSCILPALLACSCERTPSRSNTDAQAEQPAPPSPEQRASTFLAPDSKQLAALETALAGHLLAAREATDAAARTAALERAVEIIPFDATTLAELGRVHADSGRLVDAVLSFELAVRHADDVPQRAALLVDLAAAVEATGDLAHAAELYQSSVSLHPTEIAAIRLAELAGGVEVISHTGCVWIQHGPAPTELCPAYVQGRGASPSTCVRTHPTLEVDADTKVTIFSHLDPITAIEVYVVNVILGGMWFSSPLTWVSHPEAAHADEAITRLDMRLEQLAPDRKPQVVFEWEVDRRAVDPVAKTLVTRGSSNLGVLGLGAGEPRWWLGLRTASRHSERLVSDDSDATVTETSVAVTWIPKTGEFELLRTEHSPSTKLGRFPLGSYPVLCPSEIDGS